MVDTVAVAVAVADGSDGRLTRRKGGRGVVESVSGMQMEVSLTDLKRDGP